MGDSTFRTCFVVAPLGADTFNLRRALATQGVEPREVADLVAGANAPETVESAIRDADFVCGVIPHGPASANVYLELGMALGLGRPLLLFAEPGAELPVSLRGQPYARTSLTSAEALDAHIETFLKHVGENGRPLKDSPPFRARPTALHLLNPFLDQLAAWEDQRTVPSERELVPYLANVLEAAGYLTATSGTLASDVARPDIAVWIDELHTTIGNPLAIEVAAGNGQISPGASQLQNILKEQQSPLGLLVVWRRPDQLRMQGELTGPIVVVMSVREFVDAVRTGDLARVLLDPRRALIQSAA